MESAVIKANAPSAGGAEAGGDWRLEVDGDGIAWLHLDKDGAAAGTNVLSPRVFEELNGHLTRLQTDAPRGLVIVSDKTRGFIAGADVHEFTKARDQQAAMNFIALGQDTLQRLADLPCPTVAVIHGYCLGGGTELALACRYRVAVADADTVIGLPEVRLGIHPGFGGTVRLPPLIGAPAALNLMLSGRTVKPRAALRLGLVDTTAPARHAREAARRLVLDKPARRQPARWLRITQHRWLRPWLARYLRRRVAAQTNPAHYPAPYALIELWERYADDAPQMLRAEAESVARLVRGETAQNLVRVFLLRERLKRLARTPEVQACPRAQHVHLIGGGVMGGDIAAWCALNGLRVTIQDNSKAALARVIQRAANLFGKRLEGRAAVRAALDRLMPDPLGYGLPKADVIIEAIYEDVAAKQALFRDIEARIRADALLATNTSSIPLQTLASVLQTPERLVGLHFFNPVAKMPLVEVVQADNTDTQAAHRALAFTAQIDRLPLPTTSTPGFLVNRVLMPYLLEAVRLEQEGTPAAQIDQAALAFGMPMGPLRLADTVGLDICLHVGDLLAEQTGLTVPQRLRELVSAGHLGVKSGRGFYQYRDGRPHPPGRDAAEPASAETRDRLVGSLLNESIACLREAVVADADLVDAGLVFGAGFAPFRGGPLHYAKNNNPAALRQRLAQLQQTHGLRFTPDAGWDRLEEGP